jgi:hypothetical protein
MRSFMRWGFEGAENDLRVDKDVGEPERLVLTGGPG